MATVKLTPAEANDVQHRDIAVIVLLMIVTLGIYWFYLCYVWAKEINGLTGRVKYQPWAVLLVNIVTCGLAGIVFECLFAFDIAEATNARGTTQRMENLPAWIVGLNVATAVLAATAYGVIVAMALGIIASAMLQMELNKLAVDVPKSDISPG